MSVLLVPDTTKAQAREAAEQLASVLEKQGYEVLQAPSPVLEYAPRLEEENVQLVVSLGGDGTLLRAANIVQASGVPILGISYGHLGFLTAAPGAQQLEFLQLALAGELHASKRAVLEASVTYKNHTGNTYQVDGLYCLNELELSRGIDGSIVSFEVSVSGNPITSLRADGFVVSSATGSTSYALSAGGPVVTPNFGGMICVPVAPHTLQARAFLTSASDVVELTVTTRKPGGTCLVYRDGQLVDEKDATPTYIIVKRAPFEITLLDEGAASYYRGVSRTFYGNNN